MQQTVVLTWQLSEVHGWGLVGLHTVLHLLDQGRIPLLGQRPLLSALRPANRARIEPLLEAQQRLAAIVGQAGDRVVCLEGTTVLQALGNGFIPAADARLRGSRTVGVIAFENTLFDAGTTARARDHDRIVVHSTYNQELLFEQGFTNVGLAFQGVDPGELAPAAPAGRFGDRFVVFSGGKIEFRKGQDLVLAAFRRFRERRPDALLVTAWHNHWPHTSATIAESPHTPAPPAIGENNRLRIVEWAMAHGVAPDGFVDMGFIGRDQIAPILADCHAAVFPNRCEGATNLVAMEAMACGVPVVLSANTGHLDLIRKGNCLPLSHQTPVADPDGSRRGWCESSVDELVEQLDRLYTDRALARACAEKGRAFVRGERTWDGFARSFVEAVD